MFLDFERDEQPDIFRFNRKNRMDFSELENRVPIPDFEPKFVKVY